MKQSLVAGKTRDDPRGLDNPTAGKFNSIGLIADIKSRAVTKIAVAFRARRRNGNGKWTKGKTSGKSVLSIEHAAG